MKQSRLNLSLIALLVLTTLTGVGCTLLGKRIGAPIAVEPAEMQEGVTSVTQAVALLGPPTHMSALPSGMVMVYEYVQAKERQLGINLDTIGLQWFKFSFGRAEANHQDLLLLFDDDGLLQAREFQDWTEKLGSGFGFQLFFIAMPIVDTRHLNAKPAQLSWGRADLEPLPVTLNAGQSLSSGDHGIELRGTPDSVGQRTLEMAATQRRKQRGD
jgi:hypothetical protein